MSVPATESKVSQVYIDNYVAAAIKLNPKMTRDEIDFALSHTIVREMQDKGKVVSREALLKDIKESKGVPTQASAAVKLAGDSSKLAKKPNEGDPAPEQPAKPVVTQENIYRSVLPMFGIGEGNSFGLHLGKLLSAQGIDAQNITQLSEPRALPEDNKDVVGVWISVSEDGNVGMNYRIDEGKELIDETKFAGAMFTLLDSDKFPEDARPEGWVYVEIQLAPSAEKPINNT